MVLLENQPEMSLFNQEWWTPVWRIQQCGFSI